MKTTVLALLWLCAVSVNAQRALQEYNVDRSQISTSGVSSGAAMATQLHVAYSSLVMGAGLIAGNPYYCAQGSSLTATGACMSNPNQIDVSELIAQADRYSSDGEIDPTSNLNNDRVFILAGTLDTTVDPGVGPKVQEFYSNYGANIRTVYDLDSEHTFPTIDYGNACDVLSSPYISRCNYNAAYEILNHMYPGLTRPSGNVPLNGDFYEFDQVEFFYISPPSASSMDDVGYVYVPSGCMSGANVCRLHVALHGCDQGRYEIGDEYARNTGYNEVGELNNIIILYPQAENSLNNPLGCWDWWGYTVFIYATKEGNQPLAISRMIDRVAG